jgi:CheY-like chemotaxis protein
LRGNGGYEVIPCEDAANAIRQLRRDEIQPDFVLLDWSLPGASEILRHFVSRPRFVRSHVIVLSDQQKDVPQLCVSAVVPRTITGNDIIATLDRVEPVAASVS